MTEASFLKTTARALGFEACGIAPAPLDWAAADGLEAFLDAGHHAGMDWMATTRSRRRSPRALWPEARSAVVVAKSYAPDHDPMETLALKRHGNISVYARGRDYHDVLKSRLKQLARAFVAQTGAEVKVFVDTAPLMEKPLAALAGLGWQGKHTNLLARDLGNWVFLGVMLTSAELPPDTPAEAHCGTCRACLDICPTNAFPAPYRLDARRCLSYLTIEHKGPIPRAFRRPMGNRIYGCDDCLAICPWNKFAETAQGAALHARVELRLPELSELAALDDAAFREVFAGSPVKRTGRDRFVRNVAIAIGNSGDRALVSALLPRLDDASALVRGAAVWALACLDPNRFKAERAARMEAEGDPGVIEEWALGADDG